MDFMSLYTTTTGTIPRRTWWLGAIILAIVNVAISLLILPLIGLGAPNMAAMMAAGSDPQQLSTLVQGAIQASAWGSLILFVLFGWPIYCLSIKRRRDRGGSGRDVQVYLGLVALMLLLQAIGLGYSLTDMGGVQVPTPSALAMVLLFANGLFGLYMLVQLGFLKGQAEA